MFVSKSDYIDIVNFFKFTEPELYNKIKEIQKYPTKKSITSRLIYTPDENDHYIVDFYIDTISFYKTGKFFMKVGQSIFDAELFENNIIIYIPHSTVCYNSYIWKCYNMPNKNPYYRYSGYIKMLLDYFNMDTMFYVFIDDPIKNSFINIINETNYYITEIINICKENDITEPTEENLFYLKLLLS